MSRALIASVAAVILAGCGSDEPLGGAAQPASLVVAPAGLDGEGAALRPLADGDPLGLLIALQGGHVMLVGPRVQGMPPGLAEVRARLLDPDTQAVAIEETRELELISAAGDPAWLEPRIEGRGGIVHLLGCPNYGARAIAGAPWELSVEVTQSAPPHASGSASVSVVPTCMQAEGPLLTLCECECSAGYFAGKCVPPG